VTAVLLLVLVVYALAHDASSCRLSRRTQPVPPTLSLALPRLLSGAALDLRHPALHYRGRTRDLTLCVLAALSGSTRLGFDPNDPDILPLFCPLRHPAAPAILDVLCCLLLPSCGFRLPCSPRGYALLGLFVLLFLVVFLVRLGVFLLPTGDVFGSATASFSSRPVRSPCRMLWHARLRTMCALRIVLDVLLFLPYLVLP